MTGWSAADGVMGQTQPAPMGRSGETDGGANTQALLQNARGDTDARDWPFDVCILDSGGLCLWPASQRVRDE